MDSVFQIILYCITVISGTHDSSMEITSLLLAQSWTALGRIPLGDDARGAVHCVGTACQYLYLERDRQGLGLSEDIVQTRSTMCNPPCKL